MNIKDNLTSTIVKIISNNVTFNWFQPYKTADESESIGTGFFINDKGYILTCSHVVVDAINKKKIRYDTRHWRRLAV